MLKKAETLVAIFNSVFTTQVLTMIIAGLLGAIVMRVAGF
jgi:predicted PurR-regulated permease PerM